MWFDEQVDLSPLVGHDALFRFEYVTDQAYNGEGFALADFAVPELGLNEPGAVEGSWSADGWVRVDGPLPEHWQCGWYAGWTAALPSTPSRLGPTVAHRSRSTRARGVRCWWSRRPRCARWSRGTTR